MGNCHSFCYSFLSRSFASRYLSMIPLLRQPEQLSLDIEEQLNHARDELEHARDQLNQATKEQLDHARDQINQATKEQLGHASEQLDHARDKLNQAKEEQLNHAKDQLNHAKDQLNNVQWQLVDAGRPFKEAITAGIDKSSASITNNLPHDLSPKNVFPGSMIPVQTVKETITGAIDQSSASIAKNLPQLNPKSIFSKSMIPHGV